jgi:hypothetical protein
MIEITEEELTTLQNKAQKWDSLGEEIERLYTTTPDGDEIPEDELGMDFDDDGFNLVDIGEVAAVAYGWL